MHIVLGATGHVGSAVARTLLDRGEPVTVVTRDARRAASLARRGAAVAEVDVRDADALGAVLRRGARAFLLNPPGDPTGDPLAEERRTVAGLARAVGAAGLEKVVVQSTYGAQPGDAIGDLGVLWELERAIAALPVRASVVRGAYFLSNWDAALAPARAEGIVPSFLPVAAPLPMVAPEDVGRVAARLLTDDADLEGVVHVEGPAPYAPADVARAFAAALGRDVRAAEVPRERWEETFRSLGFSAAGAASFAGLTAVVADGAYERPAAPVRGTVTLEAHVAGLVGG